MGTISNATYCIKNNPAGIASANTVIKHERAYVQEAEERGAEGCSLKISQLFYEVLENIGIMCQSGLSDMEIIKKTSLMITEKSGLAEKCIASMVNKNLQDQKENAGKIEGSKL